MFFAFHINWAHRYKLRYTQHFDSLSGNTSWKANLQLFQQLIGWYWEFKVFLTHWHCLCRQWDSFWARGSYCYPWYGWVILLWHHNNVHLKILSMSRIVLCSTKWNSHPWSGNPHLASRFSLEPLLCGKLLFEIYVRIHGSSDTTTQLFQILHFLRESKVLFYS